MARSVLGRGGIGVSLHVYELPTNPRPGVKLHCVRCGGTFSARKGDYFAAEPTTELVHCGYDMELVMEETHVTSITPANADTLPAEEKWP